MCMDVQNASQTVDSLQSLFSLSSSLQMEAWIIYRYTKELGIISMRIIVQKLVLLKSHLLSIANARHHTLRSSKVTR